MKKQLLIFKTVLIALFSNAQVNTHTGHFYNINGVLQGIYNLDLDYLITPQQPDSLKSMKNTDIVATTFTGSWSSFNNTYYVKDNSFDYNNATYSSISSSYNSGTPSISVNNPSNGDIYIARRNSTYYAIRITNIDPTNNDCGCGNKGKIEFEYKKGFETTFINEIDDLKFNIYPNPTTDIITIKAKEIKNIVVMDVSGKQIYNGKETIIHLKNEPKGIYIVKLTTAEKIITQNFIKQ